MRGRGDGGVGGGVVEVEEGFFLDLFVIDNAKTQLFIKGEECVLLEEIFKFVRSDYLVEYFLRVGILGEDR